VRDLELFTQNGISVILIYAIAVRELVTYAIAPIAKELNK